MDNELFELCKQVYEKTGWTRTHKVWHEDTLTSPTACGYEDIKHAIHFTPLYTSDYVLEKLPHEVMSVDEWGDEQTGTFGLWKANNGYSCGYLHEESFIRLLEETDSDGEKYYRDAEFFADTSLKALLKLTLALAEAGELK